MKFSSFQVTKPETACHTLFALGNNKGIFVSAPLILETLFTVWVVWKHNRTLPAWKGNSFCEDPNCAPEGQYYSQIEQSPVLPWSALLPTPPRKDCFVVLIFLPGYQRSVGSEVTWGRGNCGTSNASGDNTYFSCSQEMAHNAQHWWWEP